MQSHWLFSSSNIYFCKCQKADEKKSKEDEQTLEELNSAHHRSKAKCQLVQTIKLNKLNCSCFCHIINILLTELSRSVWENLDLGRVYRPHCVRSVLTTSVKILPYRPPARLIRAKYYTWYWQTLYIISCCCYHTWSIFEWYIMIVMAIFQQIQLYRNLPIQ